MEVSIVFICAFLVIFGIFYLHFSTRNKERLALIEKGADASIFMHKRRGEAPPVWKVLILNLGLLMMGVGLGIIVAILISNGLENRHHMEGPVFTASIFLMAGVALVTGFFLTRKLIK